MQRYHDLTFDREMLVARRDDGSEIRFTRQERALLLQFVRLPGQLLARDRLGEWLARDSADISVRNVDFLVNRLRKRLGDNARKPRFIATQYGEGYVWIATPAAPSHFDAFLVIGPVYGLNACGPLASEVIKLVSNALEARLGPGRHVASVPDWSPASAQNHSKAKGFHCSLDASFHESDMLHAAFMLRDGATRHVIAAFRAKFAHDDARGVANTLAEDIKAALWAHLALPHGPIIAAADTPSTSACMTQHNCCRERRPVGARTKSN